MKKDKKKSQNETVVEHSDMSFNEVMAQIRANRKKVSSSSKGKGNKKSSKY